MSLSPRSSSSSPSPPPSPLLFDSPPRHVIDLCTPSPSPLRRRRLTQSYSDLYSPLHSSLTPELKRGKLLSSMESSSCEQDASSVSAAHSLDFNASERCDSDEDGDDVNIQYRGLPSLEHREARTIFSLDDDSFDVESYSLEENPRIQHESHAFSQRINRSQRLPHCDSHEQVENYLQQRFGQVYWIEKDPVSYYTAPKKLQKRVDTLRRIRERMMEQLSRASDKETVRQQRHQQRMEKLTQVEHQRSVREEHRDSKGRFQYRDFHIVLDSKWTTNFSNFVNRMQECVVETLPQKSGHRCFDHVSMMELSESDCICLCAWLLRPYLVAPEFWPIEFQEVTVNSMERRSFIIFIKGIDESDFLDGGKSPILLMCPHIFVYVQPLELLSNCSSVDRAVDFISNIRRQFSRIEGASLIFADPPRVHLFVEGLESTLSRKSSRSALSCEMSLKSLDDVLVFLELEQSTTIHQHASKDEILFDLARCWRYLAEAPYTRKSHSSTDIVSGALPRYRGSSNNPVFSAYVTFLMQIPRISEQIAIAVTSEYPTLRSLLNVYENPDTSIQEKDRALADIRVPSLSGNRERRVGPLASTLIYRYFSMFTLH